MACRGCGAPIIFAVTEKGRQMPLDAEPTPDGEWSVADTGDLIRAVSGGHKTHFETCPVGRKYRKRHKGGQRDD